MIQNSTLHYPALPSLPRFPGAERGHHLSSTLLSDQSLTDAQPGELLRFRVSENAMDDLYFEVIRCRRRSRDSVKQAASIEAISEGELVRIAMDADGGRPSFEHLGHWPRLSEPWLKSTPTLQATLKAIRQQQAEHGSLPSQIAATAPSNSSTLDRIVSLDEFEGAVASDPSYWCDGTGPNDAPSTALQTALLSAGEVLTFLNGSRGVVLVQLDVGFDPQTRLPILRPFLLQTLQRALTAKGVVVYPSAVPGTSARSLILASKQEPFRSWAAHLAQLGVQASVVADSPFYKLLVGKILGYKSENIEFHIRSQGQRLEETVIAAVDEELKKLNPDAPKLPWIKTSCR